MYIYMFKYYSAIKKNKIIPFVAIWMDLGIIILNAISQRNKNIISHMQNLKKYDVNELSYKIETYLQTYKTNLWLPRGKGGEGIMGIWD